MPEKESLKYDFLHLLFYIYFLRYSNSVPGTLATITDTAEKNRFSSFTFKQIHQTLGLGNKDALGNSDISGLFFFLD